MTRGEVRHRFLGRTGRTVIAAIGTCLLVCIIGWAALIGPSQVVAGPGPEFSRSTPAPTPTDEVDVGITPEDLRVDADGAGGEPVLMPAFTVVVQGLTVGLGALLVFLLVSQALRAWERRRRYDRAPDVDFDVVGGDQPDRVRRAIADDVEQQQHVLAQGEPRNAIVDCWHRFELQAAAAGMPRREWETSSELALRLFEQAEVDGGAVSRLLALYREARFSEHDLDEADRAAAAAALTEIQDLVGPRRSAPR